MQKIHNDDCGNHLGGRSLAHKVINQGYYWPKMFDDAKDSVKKCSECKRFAPESNRLSTDLHTLQSPWPFMQWGLNVVGPLSRAQPQLQFLPAATDYLTKWVKVTPLSEVIGQQIIKFLW